MPASRLLIGAGSRRRRHAKLLIHLAMEGAFFGAYSHCIVGDGFTLLVTDDAVGVLADAMTSRNVP
jgi:hypothetical protein